MRAKDIEAMLEKEGFDLQEDNTDVLGYGNKVYVHTDPDDRVQVIISVEKAKN